MFQQQQHRRFSHSTNLLLQNEADIMPDVHRWTIILFNASENVIKKYESASTCLQRVI